MRKKLIIDVGNTLVKAAVFEDKVLKDWWFSPVKKMPEFLKKLSNELPFSSGILSAVREYPAGLQQLVNQIPGFLILEENTPLPLSNTYETPSTLGKDRLAAACGGKYLFPGKNLLIVNTGTCITYDVITKKGEYIGGSISPGLTMRFKALHTFTGRLPLLSLEPAVDIPGKNTHDSILSGVMTGAIQEVKGMISRYQETTDELTVVLSGGDSSYFENQLKNGIFVVRNIVLTGLNEILDYNV